MTATNEQAVVALEEEIQSYKKKYIEAVQRFNDAGSSALPTEQRLRLLNEVHSAGVEYFNRFERYVRNTSLFGAHKNQDWLRGVADDCENVLKSILTHYEYMRSACAKYGFDLKNYEPSARAYSGMQRLVRKFLSESANELCQEFKKNSLPVDGFEQKSEMLGKNTFALIAGSILALLGAGAWIFSGQRLNQLGYSSSVYYVVLVMLGCFVGLLLFGSVHSYAKIRHKSPGLYVEIGGPVAVAALVVFGGFQLAPIEQTFSVTIRVFDSNGHAPISKGKILMELDQNTRAANLNELGEADFKEIPGKFRGRAVTIRADIEDYELPGETSSAMLADPFTVSLTLTHREADLLDKLKVSLAPGRYTLVDLAHTLSTKDISISFDESVGSALKQKAVNFETLLREISLKQLLPMVLARYAPNLSFSLNERLIVIRRQKK